MPQISVIVPVYKVEKYINRCVDSILGQTFSDFEVILVDDGSPDRCGAICDAYAAQDPRVRVIHQQNGGLSAARNAGIDWVFAHSDAQWISFVDSDDYVHPDFLQVLYDAATQNDVRVSMTGYMETSGQPLEYAQGDVTLWCAKDLFAKRNVNATVAWCKLYKKECFSVIRYPVGKIHEDEFVTYKILFAEKAIAVSDAKLYGYYQNADGITKRGWTPARMDTLDALEEQILFYEENGYYDLARGRMHCCISNARNQMDQIRTCTEENIQKNYLRKCRRTLRRIIHTHPQIDKLGLIEYYPVYKDAYPLLAPLFWLYKVIRINLGKFIRKLMGNTLADRLGDHLRRRK